jgi:hypothetical protein
MHSCAEAAWKRLRLLRTDTRVEGGGPQRRGQAVARRDRRARAAEQARASAAPAKPASIQ